MINGILILYVVHNYLEQTIAQSFFALKCTLAAFLKFLYKYLRKIHEKNATIKKSSGPFQKD